ncbi:hypothetical protein NQ318_004256 [Aromia moschata]|uniref:Bromodomain associated domain-containing protein n=1 Tax=Aromia moschata TaxID=1265417 RepID=A0AAV8XQ28_9CUCU|nr:hypothetical protein NQ318_004256 [Aromia moschata]
MTTKHWGEIPKSPRSDFFMPDVTADIERSMDKFCLSEYQDETDVQTTEQIILPPMDPLMLYAISLHKYTNDMTEMIRVAELAMETNLIPPEDAAPLMPIMPEINVKHTRNCLNFMPKESTSLSCGWESELPELSDILVKKILSKCVAVMFAHIGFETTHQSVMDLLTDVLESFFQKFCCKVADAIEDEDKGVNQTGFPNAVERVLTETGMGGVKGLNDYYQNSVVKYISVLQKRCKELNDYYAMLLIPKSPSPTDKFSKIIRVKVEEDEDVIEMDNPEVHFAAFDGGTSVLETGYQLLNSLEAEENLQTLADATDENIQNLGDVTGEEATGIVFIPSEAEMSHVSPFTKRKRFK